ncbi:YveK family protein [Bacillus sp. EB600]|uniref:YveK family protein n=1 Tax=Bacillus sp. EB600 TaxID=2806345 RepID=UPI00210A79B9|nr:Wzz/FepE/Etk N-terminal domain-containing protein [Bacillus sp. EB600]MCQ6278906.1 capsular biosynthesis protein [Bacillus sp. EB600]
MNQFDQISSFDKKKAKEINLSELYKVLKRRIWAVLILTVLGAAIGFIQNTVTVTPLYQSSARVIIGADEQSRTTLQVIVKDSTILDKVVTELHLPMNSDALAKQITVASIDQSQVVSITVVNQDPRMAAQIANTTAAVFKAEVPNIVGQDYIRILSNAKVNPVPTNPKNYNKTITAIVIGLVLGIGLAFLLDSMDSTVRSEQEVEKILGLTVLGKVSKMNKRNIKRKKVQSNLDLRGETVDS